MDLVLKWVQLALISNLTRPLARDSSGCFTRCLVHSLAMVEAIVLLVAVGKVAVLKVVIAIVATTSDAVIIVASASEVFDIEVA